MALANEFVMPHDILGLAGRRQMQPPQTGRYVRLRLRTSDQMSCLSVAA